MLQIFAQDCFMNLQNTQTTLRRAHAVLRYMQRAQSKCLRWISLTLAGSRPAAAIGVLVDAARSTLSGQHEEKK